MRVLLDTHVLLWWASRYGARLSPRARDVMADPETDVLVSVVSAFEISAKVGKGRLELEAPPEVYVPALLARHQFGVLAVELPHALRAGSLPHLHGDPFDRLLVAQAQVEGIPMVTADPAIARYDVETIW